MEGDQHKMREALEFVREMINDWNASNEPIQYCQYSHTMDKIDAALSAPPRNCDVGTPDERMNRYHELCREISDRHERIGAHAPSFAFPTEFEWEDSPYEEGDK